MGFGGVGETRNTLLRCPKFLRLGAPKNFDRCAISHSLYLPPAAFVLNARTFRCSSSSKIDIDKLKAPHKAMLFNGGVGETRTLAPGFSRPTPLAGAPRHQLEYYSKLLNGVFKYKKMAERKGFEPLCLLGKRFSRPPRYDHFDTSP